MPPNPENIQAAIQSGKLAVQILEPGRRVRLDFGDFKKPGDTLGVEIDITTNRLLGLAINTYMEDAKDVVNLNVTMSVLPDGTIYAAQSVVEMPTEKAIVTITNDGFRKHSQ